MRLNTFFILSLMLMLATSCQTNSNNKPNENLAPNVHKITAQEVIQSTSYTYVRVSEDGKESWIAITKQEVEAGKIYYYEPNIEMNNFTSKELNRTFPSIWFVSRFSSTPILANQKSAGTSAPQGKQAPVAKEGIKVTPAKGGITIAELYTKKDSYSGKPVKIKGEVVKFNQQIMGKNWVHIQDGTTYNGSFDLTITTDATVKIGDVVTIEGVVAVNKDFGYGYSYDIILENGKLIP